MSIPDPIVALVTFLREDAGVAALADTRVYGAELPDSQAASMPRHAVTIQTAGGGLLTGRDFIELGDPRVDIRCYGPTPYQAMVLHRAVHPALKQMRRNVQGTCLLHWANSASQPIPLRDPDTEWPYVLSVWQVMYSEREVT